MRTGACEPQVPFQGSKDLDDGGDGLVDKNTCRASMTCVRTLGIHVELGMAMQALTVALGGWWGGRVGWMEDALVRRRR